MKEMTLSEGISNLVEQFKEGKMEIDRTGTFTLIGYTKDIYKEDLKQKLSSAPNIDFVDVPSDKDAGIKFRIKAREENTKLVGFYKINSQIDHRYTLISDFESRLQSDPALILGVTSEGIFINKNHFGDTNLALKEEELVGLL